MTDDGNLCEAIIRLAASYAFRAVDPADKRGDASKEQAEEEGLSDDETASRMMEALHG